MRKDGLSGREDGRKVSEKEDGNEKDGVGRWHRRGRRRLEDWDVVSWER
jgi:hypothetical protein